MFLRNPKVGVIVEHFGNKKDYKYKLTKDKPISPSWYRSCTGIFY